MTKATCHVTICSKFIAEDAQARLGYLHCLLDCQHNKVYHSSSESLQRTKAVAHYLDVINVDSDFWYFITRLMRLASAFKPRTSALHVSSLIATNFPLGCCQRLHLLPNLLESQAVVYSLQADHGC